MNYRILLVFFAVLAIGVNMAGIIREDFLLRRAGEVLFFFPMIAYYFRKIKIKSFNFLMFLFFALGAVTAREREFSSLF